MAEPKQEWPELVGKTAEEAKEQILKDRPGLTVQILNELSMVTADFRTDRVRIFKNNEGKVTAAPRTG